MQRPELRGVLDGAELASRLDIYNAGALTDIVRLELERGRPEAALAQQRGAMRREPGRPSHYLMLGKKLGRQAEAEEAVRKAQTLAAEARRSS